MQWGLNIFHVLDHAEYFPIQSHGVLGNRCTSQPFLNDALHTMKVCVLLSPSVLKTETRDLIHDTSMVSILRSVLTKLTRFPLHLLCRTGRP